MKILVLIMFYPFNRMFLNGLTLPIERLYPTVEFPVSRGTPMISPLIKWDHTEDFFVMRFTIQKGGHSAERKVSVSLDEFPYISGHIIDGKDALISIQIVMFHAADENLFHFINTLPHLLMHFCKTI